MNDEKAIKQMKKKVDSTIRVFNGELKLCYVSGQKCTSELLNEVYKATPKNIVTPALEEMRNAGWIVEETKDEIYFS